MKRACFASLAVMGLLWVGGCKKECPPGNGPPPATKPAEGQSAAPPTIRKDISGTDYLATVLRCEQIAQRTQSMMRLRAIGLALQMYSSEHGRYPATLADLAQAGQVQGSELVSPADGARPYVYRPPSGADLSQQIVAYETVSYGGKTPVLMGDGSVVPLDEAVLQEKLSARK